MAAPSGMVTLLFTDIQGSTRLWEADEAAMTVALARHDLIVREHIEAGGGHIFKTIGDAFCAAFADASDAVGAVVAAQCAVEAEPWPDSSPIRVRMALHSGVCVERDGDYFGPVVNRAARLLAVGHGGQILLSGATFDLVAERLGKGLTAEDLGVHRLKDLGRPERVFQLGGPGLAKQFGPLRSLDDPAVHHNLPLQATSFVGRGAELAELSELLSGQGPRLLTLTGAGGAGKTRLALQVAAELVDGTGEGVWLVELAPLAEPDLVARTVASVLGVREEADRPMLDTLVDAISDRYLLIVLDNCEHVLDSTAKLADAVLRACPRVHLLATSREPLGINGERVYRVPSLSVPVGNLGLAELAGYEAVQLFLERASSQRRDFALDHTNANAVAELCLRLDGIPLAIELAAARLRSLSVAEINSRLDQRFRLLTGGSRNALPRHQTLHALIDWSYELLNTDEQLVLDRMSVFAGGWTLEAAEHVAAGGVIEDWEVLDHLAALVDKSIVQADESDGATRYRLLETVRQFAAERLADRGDAEVSHVRAAHRDHYLALAETAAPELHRADQVLWLDRLEVEHDNLRAALAYCVAQPGSGVQGLRLAVSLHGFWRVRGYQAEGVRVLDALLRLPEAEGPTLIRAKALNAANDLSAASAASVEEPLTIARAFGDKAVAAEALHNLLWFSLWHDDVPTALTRADEGLALARELQHPRLIARSLAGRALCQGELGNDVAALADFEEALAISRAAGDFGHVAATLNNLSIVELAAGDLAAARGHLDEAIMVARHIRDPYSLASLSVNLGLLNIMTGDHRRARQLFVDALTKALRIALPTVVPESLLGLALAASADADPVLASTLHGVADHFLEKAGRQSFEALEAGLRQQDLEKLREVMGDSAVATAHERGRKLPQAEALALALDKAENTTASW